MQDKKILKMLISSLSSMLVTVVALISASVAWFSNDRNVNGNGMSMNLASPELCDIELKVYPVIRYGITKNDNATTTFQYDTTVETAEIPTYDPSEILDSGYEKVIVLELSFELEHRAAVDLAFITKQGWIVDREGTENGTVSQNYFSNCVQITPATVTAANKVTVTDGDFRTFVNPNTLDKVYSLDYVTDDLTAGENKVYFVMEYNISLLNTLSGQVLGTDILRFEYATDVSVLIAIHKEDA